MAKVGKKAPKWTATVYDNGERSVLDSADLKGKWYLIYWWPFNFTGICNSEVKGFQSLHSQFQDAGIELIGASCNTIHSHQQWFDKSDQFDDETRPKHPVIADNSHRITRKFKFFSKEISCAFRATVLVDPEGVVQAFSCNHLGVAIDPKDALLTALAFVKGGGCTLEQRDALLS